MAENTNGNTMDTPMGARVERAVAGTPRHFNTYHKKTPFRESHKFQDGEPDWIKVGRGLIAVTDGSKKKLIAPGLIFAVDQDENGQYRIGQYGFADGRDKLGIGRPYAFTAVRTSISDGDYARTGWISYSDMVLAIRRVLPMAWVPTEAEFYAEYGF